MNNYAVTITTCGNPDKGQDPYKPLFGVPAFLFKAKSLEELQAKVLAFQSEHCIGSGNWVDPKVKFRGKIIGSMSYNGKVWKD